MLEVAVVNLTAEVSPLQIQEFCIAGNAYLHSDFDPVWGTDATLRPADNGSDILPGEESVIITDAPLLEAGIHSTNPYATQWDDTAYSNGQQAWIPPGLPYAIVSYAADWTVRASHELDEMLVDPNGNRFVADPVHTARQQLEEVCDPVEADRYAVAIAGMEFSDFLRPTWYTASVTGAYDIRGTVHHPRTILTGGATFWRQRGVWFERSDFGGHEVTTRLGRGNL